MSEQAQAYDGKYKRIRRSDYVVAPSVRWLIDKVLPVGATIVMTGDPKCRKTFVSLAMALAAASGKPWCGLPVQKARTLYVGPEDFNGLIRRQMAWEAMHNGGEAVDLDFFNVAINLSDLKSVQDALDGIRAQDLRPDFIVIDTLQRATVGVKENDTDAMGKVFEKLDAFREEIGNPTVLIVHHNNKGGGYRGNTTIFGSTDGMLGLKKNGDYSVLSCQGMRMAGDFPDMALAFELRPVLTEDGWHPELVLSGVSKTSLKDAIENDTGEIDTDTQTSKDRTTIVDECRRMKWPKHSELEEACKEKGVSKGRFDKHMKYLEGIGRLVKEDDVEDKRVKHYRVNDGFEGGDVYICTDGKREKDRVGSKFSIGIDRYSPKGGNTDRTDTDFSIVTILNTDTDTDSDKTGTLPATPSNGTMAPPPLQTGPEHNDAFTALKELTDGPATQPSRKAGPQ